MKKIFFTVCTAVLLANMNAGAQTVQEGINHLYADRFKSAEQTFQKILATNPNTIEATYWLGQTYLDMDDNDAARQVYDKALAANGNAPLLMVGKGHINLIDKKVDEARQLFESALTVSRTNKGDDPNVLNAIGRANVDAKEGNLTYAVEKLELALQRAPKSADIALNLGNAYRKKDPGQGGGKAYEMYKLASTLNPSFAYPYVRIAKLFETQKQWDLFLENMNKAVQVDPSFSLAYYELFFYYFFTGKMDEATNYFNKYVSSRPGEAPDEYLNAQLCFGKKDFDCAITKGEKAKTEMGTKVKPRVLKLLAYAYLAKNDFAAAKRYVDEFFAKEKDGFIAPDYQLKVDIYAGAGTPCDQLYTVYMEGITADSVAQTKLESMQKAADYFKSKNCKLQEADMRLAWFNERKNASPTYLVNIGILYLQAESLLKADSVFTNYITLAPDSIYGYDWKGRVNVTIDSTMTVEPYASQFVSNYQKTLEIALTDKLRYKGQGIRAALYLAGYFNNVRSSRDTAYTYVLKGLEVDSTNAQLKGIKDIFDKQPAKGGQKPPAKAGAGNKPSASIRKASSKV
jgi:tetratricopeptide (TPR) repeat protein